MFDFVQGLANWQLVQEWVDPYKQSRYSPWQAIRYERAVQKGLNDEIIKILLILIYGIWVENMFVANLCTCGVTTNNSIWLIYNFSNYMM